MTPGTPARPTTVSVVIPVKDDADALRRCLRALELQTRRPDEIVIVDNGSIDDSSAIARGAGALVISCDEPGIPAAAAAGYDAANGEIILRMDADCLPAAGWVSAMADAFDARRDVSVLTGGARFTDGPRPLRASLAACYLGGYATMCSPALGHLPLFGSNMGFRRSAWWSIRSSVHQADPELHDDLDLAFHFGERHRIAFVPGAAMGISMRPFTDGRAFRRRIVRGARTIVVHWPADFPPVRWVRLTLRRVLHRLRVPTPRAAS